MPSTHDLVGTVEYRTLAGDVFAVDAADAPLLEGLRFYSHRVTRRGAKRTTAVHVYGKGVKGSLAGYLMKPPAGMVVDHINRDPLDNTRRNLRVCTPEQNGRNLTRRFTASNPALGVSLGKRCKSKPYRAKIYLKGRSLSLGYFATVDEASAAYAAAARQHYGEFVPAD